MAKQDTPKFVIGKAVAVTGTGEDRYHDEVAALIDAENELSDDERDSGVHANITLQFPTTPTLRQRKNKDTGETETVETDTVARYKRYFQDSAKLAGKTAREVGSKPQGDDAVLVTFILTDLVKRPRRNATTTEPPASTPVPAVAPADAGFAGARH